MIMTPVIFITFLVSLSLVDFRYSAMRSQYHAEQPSRLPPWLHRLIYRYRPYQYVVIDEKGDLTGKKADARYYHSKQRKLMKMEIDDAFEIRSTVLVALGLLSMVVAWATWRVIVWCAGFAEGWKSPRGWGWMSA